jgi:hypothetical protein
MAKAVGRTPDSNMRTDGVVDLHAAWERVLTERTSQDNAAVCKLASEFSAPHPPTKGKSGHNLF